MVSHSYHEQTRQDQKVWSNCMGVIYSYHMISVSQLQLLAVLVGADAVGWLQRTSLNVSLSLEALVDDVAK